MKRARRMALAPAGEQSAGSHDECVRAGKLNLITSARPTMRDNKQGGERRLTAMVLIVIGIVSVSRRGKKDTCEEPRIQKSE